MGHKNIILHSHIFKNAGTTIDKILSKNFGSEAISLELENVSFLSSKNIIGALEQKKDIVAISSHRLALPVPMYDSIRFIPLIMLRDPLDRLGSMYAFHRKTHQVINHECLLAKTKSFKDFVEVSFDADLDGGFSNLQAHFFIGNSQYGVLPPSDDTWGNILASFDATHCVGIVERFDESMVLWGKFLREFFPGIDLTYAKENVSEGRLSNLDRRLDVICEELGPALVDEFKKRNRFDYLIYNYALNRMDKEISRYRNFDQDLAEFSKGNDRKKTVKLTGDADAPFEMRHWLKNGKPKCISVQKGSDKIEVAELPRSSSREFGNSVVIVGCEVFDYNSGSQCTIVIQDQLVEVAVVLRAKCDIIDPIVGITVEDGQHNIVFSMNSFFAKNTTNSPRVGNISSYSFVFKIPPLNAGSYAISPAFATGTQESHKVLCAVDNAVLFVVPKMINPKLPGVLYISEFVIK